LKADGFIDVLLELPIMDAELLGPKGITDKLRAEGDRRCEEFKAELRTDRAPEFVIEHAFDPINNCQVILAAARFPVVGPQELFESVGR
jgi:hypothetical protein